MGSLVVNKVGALLRLHNTLQLIPWGVFHFTLSVSYHIQAQKNPVRSRTKPEAGAI